jgi:hypothetical protein
MSISAPRVEVALLLKTIPASSEKSDLLEFTFGPEPIIKLIAGEAVTLKIDFICAAPDLVVIWCVVCRSTFCVGLNGAFVKLQNLNSLAFRCHVHSLSRCRAIAPEAVTRIPRIAATTSFRIMFFFLHFTS